ncbi:hypothetical protein M514_10292 [Trichuris suis]|uniref:Uncharacterized protein n=1 Tax=Trichuris suis TaxID=68888 RepID=A0A085NIT8_9BILA|nr:hypothetical protein M513_10292 [Trichuris suis]KFD69384.1 hypothetical protein M514_10292 [Trichuris suis]KHJ41193.1 hypothetical protein D918_08780 [Trichuris suis]
MGGKGRCNSLLSWIGKRIRGGAKLHRRVRCLVSGVSLHLRSSQRETCFSNAEPRLTRIVKRTDDTMRYTGEEVAAQRVEGSKISIDATEVVVNCRPEVTAPIRKMAKEKQAAKKQAHTDDFFRRNTATVVEELYKKRKANRPLLKNIRKSPITDNIAGGPPSVKTEYSPKENLQKRLSKKRVGNPQCISETKHLPLTRTEVIYSKFRPYKTLNSATRQQQYKTGDKAYALLRSASAPVPTVSREPIRLDRVQACATKQMAKPLENDRKTNNAERANLKCQSMHEKMNELKKQWHNDVSTSGVQLLNAMSHPHDHPICTHVNDEMWKNLHPKLRNATGLLKENKIETTKMVSVESEKPSSKQAATSGQLKDKSNLAKPNESLDLEKDTLERWKAERIDDAHSRHVRRSKETPTDSKEECAKAERNLRNDAAMHKIEILKSADSALTEYSERLKSMLTTFERSYEGSRKVNMDEQVALVGDSLQQERSYAKSSATSMETASTFQSEFEYSQGELTNDVEPYRSVKQRDSSYSTTEDESLGRSTPECSKGLQNTRSIDGLFPVRKIYLPLHQPFFTLFLSSRSPGRVETTKSKDSRFN